VSRVSFTSSSRSRLILLLSFFTTDLLRHTSVSQERKVCQWKHKLSASHLERRRSYDFEHERQSRRLLPNRASRSLTPRLFFQSASLAAKMLWFPAVYGLATLPLSIVSTYAGWAEKSPAIWLYQFEGAFAACLGTLDGDFASLELVRRANSQTDSLRPVWNSSSLHLHASLFDLRGSHTSSNPRCFFSRERQQRETVPQTFPFRPTSPDASLDFTELASRIRSTSSPSTSRFRHRIQLRALCSLSRRGGGR